MDYDKEEAELLKKLDALARELKLLVQVAYHKGRADALTEFREQVKKL